MSKCLSKWYELSKKREQKPSKKLLKSTDNRSEKHIIVTVKH